MNARRSALVRCGVRLVRVVVDVPSAQGLLSARALVPTACVEEIFSDNSVVALNFSVMASFIGFDALVSCTERARADAVSAVD